MNRIVSWACRKETLASYLKSSVSEVHDNSSRGAEPLTKEGQTQVLITITRENRSTCLDEVFLHVRPEVSQKLNLLAQSRRVLIHRVVQFISVSFHVLDSSRIV